MKPSLLVRTCTVAAVVGLVALGGCGRRGALSPPPSSAAVQNDPGTPETGTPEAAPTADKPFILDPLI